MSTQLAWFDRAGKQLETVGQPGFYRNLVLAPDEKRAAVEHYDSSAWTTDIWMWDLVRRTASRLTFDPGFDSFAVFSPDGSRILFYSQRNSYLKAASGVGQPEELLKTANAKVPADWLRDGRLILYQDIGPTTNLWVLPLGAGGDRKPFPYLKTQFNERQGKFSPDGRWVAYCSDESGSPQVYVQSMPPSGGKWQVSTNGGVQPRWRADGKELFYIASDRKLMAVPVRTGTTFEAGTPVPLFETRLSTDLGQFSWWEYSVTGDGKRFLIANPLEAASVPISVVVNWAAGLKR